MKIGNNIDVHIPCCQLIADVHNAFRVFVTGVYPRSSKRSHLKRKRKEDGMLGGSEWVPIVVGYDFDEFININ